MAAVDNRPARYIRLTDPGGIRYKFFCEASGAAVCVTEAAVPAAPREELRLAWEGYGRRHFNRCTQCSRWVCDVMYNADTGRCVLCSPWEESPGFCSACGELAIPMERYCRKCGKLLRYGEVVLNE